MKIRLKPWMTPNFVILDMPPRARQEGLAPLPGIPLCDVSAENLADLCDQFRAEVFRKAKQVDPGDIKAKGGV